ncbi:MAG: hypoxanthine phosphoribosyltransferase [Planctomycetia bacterium]|nr:hypoxanthine phosphoribosyltransferase [Planctomycetia bacterium]
MQILITAERIQQRLDELAVEIKQHYQGQPLTIVGVLTGCLMFLADLVRRLDMPIRLALVQASSYRGAVTRPGELRVRTDLLPDLRGRHVLLLDDILDTGRTLVPLVEQLRAMEPASLRVGVLLHKEGRQELPLKPDYCGFHIPDLFVIGYGLDYNDEYRQLPYVAVLPMPSSSTDLA